MELQPLYDRVIVRRVEADKLSAGGLIIPENAKEKPIEGEVVSVGPGKQLDDGEFQAMTLSKGDRVLFGKYGGTEVKLDNVDHLILREDEVLAIILKGDDDDDEDD